MKMRFALVSAIAVFSACLAAPIREEDRLDFLNFIRAFEDESPDEVKFYRTLSTMSDDDHAAFERAGHALMSPTANAEEKKQLAQKLFEEHPHLLHVFLAGRGLFDSLNPEAQAFFGTLAKEGRSLPTVKDGNVDRKQLVDFLKKSVGEYQDLSEDAKESLKSTFPAMLALLRRELTNDEIADIWESDEE